MLVFFQRFGLFARPIAATTKIALLLTLSFGITYASENLEYKIKAAYLYNFTKFISWPDKNTTTFNICIVGQDPFQNLLDSLETKTAQGKPIRVFRYSDAKQTADCHIVYFDTSPAPANTLVFGSLTVSSQPSFAESGGMIGFVLENGKVKLQINLKALKQNGLGISAKLIEVATLVEGDGNE
ncbi:YfiR family protein [Methylomonas sp. MgM2]